MAPEEPVQAVHDASPAAAYVPAVHCVQCELPAVVADCEEPPKHWQTVSSEAVQAIVVDSSVPQVPHVEQDGGCRRSQCTGPC